MDMGCKRVGGLGLSNVVKSTEMYFPTGHAQTLAAHKGCGDLIFRDF